MAVDPLWGSVNMLLHMEGTNNANTFTDTTGRTTVTASGQAKTVTAQYKYGSTSCALVPANLDNLIVGNTAWLDIQDQNFCVEAFIRLNAYSASYGGTYQAVLFGKSSATVRTFDFAITGTVNSWTGLQMRIWDSGAAADTLTASYTFSLNTWYHVAFCRLNGVGLIFVDGVSKGVTGSFTRICRTTTDQARIGFSLVTTYSCYFPGHIDEFRLTVGNSRYFPAVVTTPSGEFSDDGSDPYWATTTLLMHMNGSDQGTTFTDQKSHTVSRVGTPVTVTGQKKFGTASAYFNGTTDCLSIPNSADFALESAGFSIELWFYVSDIFTRQGLVSNRNSSANGWALSVYLGYMRFYHTVGTAVTSSNSPVPNAWNYVCLTRATNTFSFTLNGVMSPPVYMADGGASTQGLSIGAEGYSPVLWPLNGYIDELRITKAGLRYVNFTPSAASDTVPTNQRPAMKVGLTYDTTQQAWYEQWWNYPLVISGKSCQQYLAVGVEAPRQQGVAQPITGAAGWIWYHPGQHRTRMIVHANRTYIITVRVTFTSTTLPRPTLRVLANYGCGITEQTSVAPAVANVEQTLSVTISPTANGVITIQQEWWAIQAMNILPENTCAWRSLSVTYA